MSQNILIGSGYLFQNQINQDILKYDLKISQKITLNIQINQNIDIDISINMLFMQISLKISEKKVKRYLYQSEVS